MIDSFYSFLQSWASGSTEMFFFYFIAFLAIPLAYGMMFDPRIIRSGFLLIAVFSAISGIFLLLTAQFLAMAQLMIYSVGITLVVVIALMLTNPRMDPDAAPSIVSHKAPAFLVAVGTFITLYFAIRQQPWQLMPMPPYAAENNVMVIGLNLLTYYALPFEFASVLLFIALVGAITLAKHDAADRTQRSASEDNAAQKERKQDVVQV